jgi:hypothetical protein
VAKKLRNDLVPLTTRLSESATTYIMMGPAGGGTGSSLAHAIIITSGVAALVSSLLSLVYAL